MGGCREKHRARLLICWVCTNLVLLSTFSTVRTTDFSVGTIFVALGGNYD